jgi:guanylate kinase
VLDDTEVQLRTIIAAERLRLSQQPDIVESVRRLNGEFEERQ